MTIESLDVALKRDGEIADWSEQIRPFEEQDREGIVEIMNRGMPRHRHFSAAEWKRWDEVLYGPESAHIRLVVGDPAIAYLDATDRGTTFWKREGNCDMELFVAHEHRRHGIGSMLYERALAFALSRNSRKLRAWFTEFSSQEPAIAFLKQRGFYEQEREQPSYLDLATYDRNRFPGAIERAEQNGIKILAYADVDDNEENRRKFYELSCAINRDIPHRDPQQTEPPPFEQWAKSHFEVPEYAPDALILAESEGKWVAFTQLAFQEGTRVGNTWTTGVLPDYRGKGIATAIKLRVLEAALARGCEVITTENHEDNGPMLAINRKLGFVPDYPQVGYNKDLS